MGFEFLTPLDIDLLIDIKRLSSQHLASKVVFHTQEDFPDLNQVSIAILGVLEHRGSGEFGLQPDLAHVRLELYSLFPGNWQHTIADLGDIDQGETVEDTYFAVQQVVNSLLKKNIVPIIIGGSQDLTYPLYRAYDTLEQMVNIVAVDSKFDLGRGENPILSDAYLSKIIIDEPNNLFNFCNIGYQTYYNSQEEIDLIEKLYFDPYRLGEITANIAISEPIFRDADFVSIDINSIKSSDSGNVSTFVPNGFNGKEICTLARYSGISDKVSLFGIFNQTYSKSEAVIIAQMIWYFIEGYHFRSNEYPFGSNKNYNRYIVSFEEGDELIFYKSDKTDRWWIEIPQLVNNSAKLKKHTLLPCSHEDYLAACNNEIPERYWKAQRKNIL
jgi:arginase family enzyme